MLTRPRQFFRWLRSLRPRAIGLILVLIYVSAAAISIVVAHVLIVLQPQSVLGERIITPVARGLEFVDTHWKGVLILVLPFIAPIVQDLIPRLRKLGSAEFGPVPLVPEGAKEKPSGLNLEQCNEEYDKSRFLGGSGIRNYADSVCSV